MKKSDFIKALLRCIPAAAIILISWYLSSQEHVEHMPSFWSADKIVHFVCFGGLCFWVSFACGTKKLSAVWIPVLVVSLYGIIDEWHQSFVVGRSCSVFDWLADTAGAVMGAFIFVLLMKKLREIQR